MQHVQSKDDQVRPKGFDARHGFAGIGDRIDLREAQPIEDIALERNIRDSVSDDQQPRVGI